MAKQQLINIYKQIEKERKELKEQWVLLKKTHADPNEIRTLGKRLTKLTLNQVHILIDLEWFEDESN